MGLHREFLIKPGNGNGNEPFGSVKKHVPAHLQFKRLPAISYSHLLVPTTQAFRTLDASIPDPNPNSNPSPKP